MTSLAYAQHWTEPRPHPEPMTDTEVLDFLDEHCYGMTYVAANSEFPQRFILECEMITTTRGRTLREAVKLAKAKINEVNE